MALSPWVRPIAYCERERYAQAVLLSRMRLGAIPIAPIWDDVRTLRAEILPVVDIVYGGFPCQDISTNGPGGGVDGERSGLVFDVLRLVSECQPRFVFLENVPALTVRGLDRVLLGINALGFDARWTVVSAAEMGAPHKRERIWILAHAKGQRREAGRLPQRKAPKDSLSDVRPEYEGWDIWEGSGPLLRGKIHGLPARVDRIRGLGNAVVPAQAREAFMRLMGLKQVIHA